MDEPIQEREGEPEDDAVEEPLGDADPDAVADAELEDPEPGRVLPRYRVDQLALHTDALGRRFFFTPEGRAVCGRRRKRKNAVIEDEACMAGPTSNGACRVHGGGAGPPLSAGGRYSKVLRGWRGLYEEARTNQALLDTREDLALMDAALAPLLRRAEEGDCPGWRAKVRDAFEALDQAVKRKHHALVGQRMRDLGKLIADGAEADEVAEDLVRHVDRRAARAHRINELEVKRDQVVSLSELTMVFASWVEALREQLDDATFRQVLPKLKALANEPRPGIVGSVEAREAEERARGAVRELRRSREPVKGKPPSP